MDIIDNGNEAAELFLKAALKNQQLASTAPVPGMGFCLNCAHALDDDRKWCDDDCRDDQQRRERLRQPNV